MESAFQLAVGPVVAEARSSAAVPGIVVAAVRGESAIEYVVDGADSLGRPLAVDSLFPVASVTKLATALVVLRLVDTGSLALDGSLANFLPGAVAAQPGVTIRRLLSHVAGLPYDLDLSWTLGSSELNWAGFSRACLRTALQSPPGIRVQYSNVGYGLLAIIVERVTGREFRDALARDVLAPLGVEAYVGEEPSRPAASIADVRGEWTRTIYEPYNTPFWRALALPWGGLITSAEGALILARAFLPSARFLSAATAAEATANQTDRLPGGFLPPLTWRECWWGLGPDLRDAKSPHWAPSTSSPLTFGHAGASGALAYADPASDIAWSILGARTADNGWLLRWGPKIAAAIIRWYQG